MAKRLAAPTGEIESASNARPGDTAEKIVRECILVHGGPDGEELTLDSSDGEISFDEERIKRVVANQNSLMAKLIGEHGGPEKMPAGAYPPILDQHADDSNDRVRGRLTGVLKFETRDVPKVGKNVPCAVADITFLGADTVSKVLDGRIFHLSVGIDENSDTLGEVSTVIEPAAPGAMVLKKGKKRLAKISVEWAKDKQKWFVRVGTEAIPGTDSDSPEAASKVGVEFYKRTYGETPQVEVKKKLKGQDMSKKVARLAKLEAMKNELKLMAEKSKSGAGKIKLAKRKGEVSSRFTKLMADKKMSPAEFKKLDLVKLAKLDKNSFDSVMEVYESREHLVRSGQQGTVNAVPFTESGTKAAEDREVKRLKAAAKKNLSAQGIKFKEMAEGEEEEKDLAADDDAEEKKKKELADKEADDKKLADGEVDAPADSQTADLSEVMKMVEENSAQIARISSMVEELMGESAEDDSEDASGDDDKNLAGEPEEQSDEGKK